MLYEWPAIPLEDTQGWMKSKVLCTAGGLEAPRVLPRLWAVATPLSSAQPGVSTTFVCSYTEGLAGLYTRVYTYEACDSSFTVTVATSPAPTHCTSPAMDSWVLPACARTNKAWSARVLPSV